MYKRQVVIQHGMNMELTARHWKVLMVGIALDVVVQEIIVEQQVERQVERQVELMAEVHQDPVLVIAAIMQVIAGVIVFVNPMVIAVSTTMMSVERTTILKIIMVKLMTVQL